MGGRTKKRRKGVGPYDVRKRAASGIRTLDPSFTNQTVRIRTRRRHSPETAVRFEDCTLSKWTLQAVANRCETKQENAVLGGVTR